MSTFNISISPAQSEYVLKPGITIIQAYDIINNSDSSITLNTEVLPWIPSGFDGSVNYNQAVNNHNLEFSLANYDIKLNQPFILLPNSKQQLILKIKANSNTILADNYYTFFVFQNQNTVKTNDSFSQATGKIGSHLLLTVSDVENPKIESSIQKFSISPKVKDVFLRPIIFKGQIKNNSDFFFKTKGKITIIKNDQIVKELEISPSNVLNNHSRNISCLNENYCHIKTPLWPGYYKVSVTLDSSLNAKDFESYFYVFPISPILLILLIFGIIFAIKKIKKKVIYQ